MKNKNILVTGGAGFIGSALVKRLVGKGANVSVVDNLSTGYLSNLEEVINDITIIQDSLCESLEKGKVKVENYDIIFHLAANPYIPPSVENPTYDYNQNLVSTFYLLETLRKSKNPPYLIYASSAAVYGSPEKLPINEKDPTLPVSPYGVSKLAGERYVAVFSSLYGIKATSLRFFSVYGPRQHKQVIYDLIEKLRSNSEELEVFGDGKQARDFIYVEDLVTAIILVTEKSKGIGEVYNLASGNSYSIKDTVQKICKICKVDPKILYSGNNRPGDAEKWTVDIKKLKKLGFKNTYSFDSGIKKVKQWADIENNIKKEVADSTRKIKILVVGDPGSIHTAKFSSLLQEIGYDVRVFQSEIYYDQDEHLKNTAIYVLAPLKKEENNNYLVGINVFINLLKNLPQLWKDKLYSGMCYLYQDKKDIRINHLEKAINQFRPDIIYSLKMQNDGYTVSEAKQKMRNSFPKWVHFNWGTDIEFFGKDKNFKDEHLPKIKKVLNNCDYFLADCERDVLQAEWFGLKGKNLGMCLATGGYDIKEISKIRNSHQERNIILIKGRQDQFGGKAWNILKAVSKIAPDLKYYKIMAMYCNPEMKTAIKFFNAFTDMNIEIVPWLPYKDLLNIYNKSIITIACSEVEGSPSFLLESMLMGAFPIHSYMESIREWITSGKNGLLYSIDNIDELGKCIKKAINDEKLIHNAQKINWKIVQDRMDRSKIKKQTKNLIENIILK